MSSFEVILHRFNNPGSIRAMNFKYLSYKESSTEDVDIQIKKCSYQRDYMPYSLIIKLATTA